MIINTLLCILFLTQPPAILPTGDALIKQAYLLASAKSVDTPKVTVDTEAAPDLAEWGKHADERD